MSLTAQSLSHSKLPGCSASLLPRLLHSEVSIFAYHSIPFGSPESCFTRVHSVRLKTKKQRSLGVVYAFGAESTVADVGERWLLEPVGDGDSRHIGFDVKIPDAFVIASNVVTVGRLPEKADIVIPVATVSGLHARIQKKGGALLVTDLDSTNGTFIDDKRLRPGDAATVAPGSCIVFGDIHLAMFRVIKLENVEATSKALESENKADADSPYESTETS